MADGSLAWDLRARVDGEVRFDAGSRGAYSTDASNFRQVPIGVVVPRTPEAAAEAVAVCRAHGVPVLSRGGGTSLAASARTPRWCLAGHVHQLFPPAYRAGRGRGHGSRRVAGGDPGRAGAAPPAPRCRSRAVILADGFSCRTQVHELDSGGREAIHLAELLAAAQAGELPTAHPERHAARRPAVPRRAGWLAATAGILAGAGLAAGAAAVAAVRGRARR